MTQSAEYPAPPFVSPAPHGYVYAGYSIAAPERGPLVRRSYARDEAAAALVKAQDDVGALPEVVSSTLHRAAFMPPIPGSPRHDLLLLVRTADASQPTQAVIERLEGQDPRPATVFTAANTVRFGETEGDMTGIFLFNHFVGAEPDTATRVWKDLAGWYTAKAGVDNSTLLKPLSETPFAVVNYVRLPTGLMSFVARQLRHPSFISYVRPRLKKNDLRALPIFYSVIHHAPEQ